MPRSSRPQLVAVSAQRVARFPFPAALVLLAVLVALPLAPASAQRDDSGVPDARSAEETEEFMDSLSANKDFGGDLVRMKLSEAVALGIENNMNLQVQRFDPLIAFEGKETAWGAYDPTFSFETGYASRYDVNNNALSAGGLGGGTAPARNVTRVADGLASVDALIPWLGASVGIEFSGNRTDSDNFAAFAAVRPAYESRANLTARIPLLKGLIWNEPWTRVKTSNIDSRGSQQNFRADLMNVVQFIETGYWNVVAQKESVRVARKSLETAQSLLDQTKTEYEVGVKSRVEVVEAEAGVASREFDLITAVNRYRRAQDELIDAVLGTQLSPGTRLEIEPADDPESYVVYEIDMVAAAEKAFQYRPELVEAELAVERQEFELKFAENQRLPQLDVVGSYGVSAIRGDQQPSTIGTREGERLEGNYGDSYDDWFSPQGGREFSVRGVVSIPIGNVAARHTVSSRQLQLRRAKSSLLKLRQDIVLEVRNASRNLESAQEGIDAATNRRRAAAEQLRAERVRLEYGESTPFNVLLKEEDLVEAENERIFAVFTYRRSVVDLHRAQGTILRSRNIVVEEAAALR